MDSTAQAVTYTGSVEFAQLGEPAGPDVPPQADPEAAGLANASIVAAALGLGIYIDTFM